MNSRAVKDQLYAHFARIGKAVANPHRIELLDLLSQGERTVEALAREANLSVANASQHLQVLAEARLVETRRAGIHVYYRLAGDAVFRFLRDLETLGRQRLAEVEQVVRMYFESRDEMEPIGAQELLERMRAGDIVVLDVRPAEEYRSGHIPEAVSIPVAELEQRLAELPADREIVAYCRGPYCVFAIQAVEILRRHGFRVRRLREGFPDWRAGGLPVAAGDQA